MRPDGATVMIGFLILGLAGLAGGQVWASAGSAMAGALAGLAALAGLWAAALVLKRGAARRRRVHLLGEFQGEIGQEEGFVPTRLEQDLARRRVQEQIAGRPQWAADSIRGLLGQRREERPSSGQRRK